MSITKLAAKAMEILPKTFNRKQLLIGVAVGLGTGVLTTSLFNCGGNEKKIGDNFERQDSIEQKNDNTKQSNTESTDTTYWYGTGEIERINYYDEGNNLKHFKEFDVDGNLKKHTFLQTDKKNKYGEYIDYNVFDASGNEIKISRPSSDGGWYTHEVNDMGTHIEEFYNKSGDRKRMRMDGGIIDEYYITY